MSMAGKRMLLDVYIFVGDEDLEKTKKEQEGAAAQVIPGNGRMLLEDWYIQRQ